MKIMIVPASEIEKTWKQIYEEKRKASHEAKINRLRKRAEKLGFELVPKRKDATGQRQDS